MAIRIGRWDCPTCGTVGVPGPETRCPNCGASRPKNVQFYLPPESEVVEDEVLIREARAGADWVCGHCHSQNKAAADQCFSCGNPRDEESEDIALREREYRPGEAPKAAPSRPRTLHPEEQPKPKRNRSWLPAVILLVVAVLGGGAIPRTVGVGIQAFSWERTHQILHKEAVQHEEWQVPAGAFQVESFQAVHHYNKVFRGYETRTRTERVQVGTQRVVCGTIDKGNGYFEDRYCNEPVYESRQVEYQEEVYDNVPVYDTKYRFRLWEWVARQEYLLRTSGNDQQPEWPVTSSYAGKEDFREGDKAERYWIDLALPGGEVQREEISFGRWSQLNESSTVQGKRAWLWGWWYGLAE